MRSVFIKLQTAVALAAILGLVGWVGWSWYHSRLPDRYNVMDYGSLDFRGGPGGNGHVHGALSADRLTGPTAAAPDVRRTLTAEQATIRLSSGRTVQALT